MGSAAIAGTLATSAGEARGVEIGPYRLLRQLARGGQGTVYLAEDTRIARRVALKIMTTLFSSIPESRLRRFRREAEVISRLDHPGICTIFDADLEGEVPYLAMRFVEGETLADLLARDGSPGAAGVEEGPVFAPRSEAELDRTLEYFEQAARALQAAHEAGVIHRDIKPGNLMVAPGGRAVILDFGLAHDDEAVSTALTQAGEVFGTPAYMAPEQITGRVEADPRTDVYALGVVLYECLARERPFEAPTREALYHAIATGDVSPVRMHNRRLPRELEVVLKKALDRDPGRRYPSAQSLEEDLRRVREKRPIRARPPGKVLRLRRWCERHPGVAGGTIGALLLLATGLVISLAMLREVQSANDRLRASILGSLSLTLKDEDPTMALLLGIESVEGGGGLTGNLALTAALEACRERLTLDGHSQAIEAAALAADRSWLVTCSSDGLTLVTDLESGAILAELEGHAGGVNHVAVTEAGGELRLATCGVDRTTRLLALGPGGELLREPVVLTGHAAQVRAAAFSPDGARIATASDDGTVRVHAVDGALERVLDDHAGRVSTVQFSPDGRLLLTASGDAAGTAEGQGPGTSDGTARIFALGVDAASAPAEAIVLEHGCEVVDACFSPAGDLVATAAEDGRVRIFATDGSERHRIENDLRALSLTWSPKGDHLAATFVGSTKLWSPGRSGVLELPGNSDRVIRSAAFSPDGSRLVTGGLDNAARIWSTGSGELLATLARTANPISNCFWTSDGAWIATTTNGRMAHVWYADRPAGVTTLAGPRRPVWTIAFDASGERLVSSSLDGTALIWDRSSGRILSELVGHQGQVESASWDALGERIVTASRDATARIWSGADGAELAVLPHPGPVQWARFSPGGDVLASYSSGGGLLLWEPGELEAGVRPEELELAAGSGAITGAGFSPGGERIAVATETGLVVVARVADRAVLASLQHPESQAVLDVAFVPGTGGARLTTSCEDGLVRTWDIASGRSTVLLDAFPPGEIEHSPDGRRTIVAHAWFGRVAVVGPGARRITLGMGSSGTANEMGMAHEMRVTTVGFSPSGRLCFTASRDGTTTLWNSDTGEPVAHFEDHTEAVLDVSISPDERWVATASRDSTARVWPVDPLPLALARKPRELTEEERARYDVPARD